MRLLMLPIGTTPKPGFRVVIDKGEPIEGRYDMCFQNACSAEIEISPKTLEALKKGTTMSVVMRVPGGDVSGHELTFTLPLKDLGVAFDGKPTDPKVLEQQRQELQQQLQKKAEEQRKMLEQQQQNSATAPAANAAAPAPAAPAPAAPAAPREVDRLPALPATAGSVAVEIDSLRANAAAQAGRIARLRHPLRPRNPRRMKASPVVAQVESSGTLEIFSVRGPQLVSARGSEENKAARGGGKVSDPIGKCWREEKAGGSPARG